MQDRKAPTVTRLLSKLGQLKGEQFNQVDKGLKRTGAVVRVIEEVAWLKRLDNVNQLL